MRIFLEKKWMGVSSIITDKRNILYMGSKECIKQGKNGINVPRPRHVKGERDSSCDNSWGFFDIHLLIVSSNSSPKKLTILMLTLRGGVNQCRLVFYFILTFQNKLVSSTYLSNMNCSPQLIILNKSYIKWDMYQ